MLYDFPLLLVILFLLRLQGAHAQQAGWNENPAWANLTRDGDPCNFIMEVRAICGQDGEISPLSPGQLYEPPADADVNLCTCNIVAYNLFSGCAAVQSPPDDRFSWVTLTTWTQNCNRSTNRTGWPHTLPPHPELPSWAFFPPNASDYFDLDRALARPDDIPSAPSTLSAAASAGPRTTTTSRPSSTDATPLSAAETEAPTASSNQSSNNLGAILGGVFGGLIGLGLIGLGLFLFIRHRRRSRMPPSAKYERKWKHVALPQNADDELPPFTPGSFNDPIFEKGVAIARAQSFATGSENSPTEPWQLPALAHSRTDFHESFPSFASSSHSASGHERAGDAVSTSAAAASAGHSNAEPPLPLAAVPFEETRRYAD